jgi:hypothetical protein
MFRNIWLPYLQASVDGILVNKITNKIGALEIKTSQGKVGKWFSGDNFTIPIYYYYQAIHYFNVLDLDFVVFYTLINTVTDDDKYDFKVLKPMMLYKDDLVVEADKKKILKSCAEFWDCVTKREAPNIKWVY